MQERTARNRRSSSPVAQGRTATDAGPDAAVVPIEWFRKRESAIPANRQMNPHNIIRVLRADSHHLLRNGVATIINEQPDMRLVSQASSGPEEIQQYRQHQPDVTLMNILLPGMNGIESLIAIRAEFSKAQKRSSESRIALFPDVTSAFSKRQTNDRRTFYESNHE